MTWPSTLDIARGDAGTHRSFYKFGITDITTTFAPIVSGNAIQLPPPSGAQALRAVSTSTDDSVAGTGARAVAISGLDANGDEITEVVFLTGTTPTALTTAEFWRVHDVTITLSGTYSEDGTNSYAGEITIQDAGSVQWAFISQGGSLPSPGAWQSSFYTVPNGYKALVFDQAFAQSANKPIFILAKIRFSANSEAVPTPWLEGNRFEEIGQPFYRPLPYPFGPLPAFTDIGWWARTQSGTGTAEIGYGIHLYKEAP
jgi:hypothetical protein